MIGLGVAELGMAGLGVAGLGVAELGVAELGVAVDDSGWIALPLDWVSQSLILATAHGRPDAR